MTDSAAAAQSPEYIRRISPYLPGKPIEELRSSEDPIWKDGTSKALRDYSTADRLLQSGRLSKVASLRYQSAVHRCMYGIFGQENTDLQDDKFRQAVYDGVVVPIEEDLMAFESPMIS